MNTNHLGHTKVLVCDDDAALRRSIVRHLHLSGVVCVEVSTGEDALAVVKDDAQISFLILDMMMPGLNGLQVLERLRGGGWSVPVLLLTGHASVGLTVQAMRLGCVNVLEKPFAGADIAKHVRESIAAKVIKAPETQLRYDRILGRSKPMQELFHQLRQLEQFDISAVLVTGESGTGKELVAQAIYRQGKRADRNLIELDCSTVPESLLESTLFGHEKGAFTDAKSLRKGLFEVAEDGVIFLDEVGELSLSAQVKLLRALEARTFRRVGGAVNLGLHAVVIAATNRDLAHEIGVGRFRQDLYYRLSVLQLKMPPLRERGEDIETLARHFLGEFCKRYRREEKTLTEGAIECLRSYTWPGNVRELRNMMEQMVVFHDSPEIKPEHLPAPLQGSRATPGGTVDGGFVLPEGGIQLQALEQALVVQALERSNGNQSHAAKLLGLSRHSFRTLMKRFGVL